MKRKVLYSLTVKAAEGNIVEMQDFALISKNHKSYKNHRSTTLILQQVLIVEIDVSGIDIVELQVVEVHFELGFQLICRVFSSFNASSSSRSFF